MKELTETLFAGRELEIVIELLEVALNVAYESIVLMLDASYCPVIANRLYRYSFPLTICPDEVKQLGRPGQVPKIENGVKDKPVNGQ